MRNAILIISLFFTSFLMAQNETVVSLKDFSERDFARIVFQVNNDMEITVKAAGVYKRRRDYRMYAKAWILRSRDRSLVWNMTRDNSKTRGRYIAESDEKIKLIPGCYELYFAVSPQLNFGLNTRDFGDFLIGVLRSSRSRDRINTIRKRCGVELVIKPEESGYVKVIDSGSFKKPSVRLSPVDDNESCSKGFAIDKSARFRVYGIGEGTNRTMDDYGWIIDETRGKVVWKMDFRRTKPGGGAEKNREIDEIINLDPGYYKVYFVTDGSHSFEEWNEMPPYDPYFYGITLWPEYSDSTKILPYKDELKKRNLVNLTRVGRDRFEKAGFTLKRPLDLRILALGEYSGRSFADYGWIINRDTREVVWKMTRSNTIHAGGAGKNRMFFDTVKFDSGNYEVMYISDGSHSFNRWNEAPPFDPSAWGIHVWAAADDFNPGWVVEDADYEDTLSLVNITEVDNSEHRTASFRLSSNQKVRIYSVGEADGTDEMYDYGWIEDQHGNIVWKAEYDYTKPAGGSRKNVLIDTTIYIGPGIYTVHYKTDGSHAFGRWNDRPPNDPEYWGIGVWKCRK